MSQLLESIFPAKREWDGAVDDVSKAPADTGRLRLKSGAKNIDRLPWLTQLTTLWCFDIGAAALDAICACPSLTALYVENINTADLSGLKRLPNLAILGLERCSKVGSLNDLAELGALRELGITDFKNVHDLSPLAHLPQLRALAVAGSMWATMRVASFQPLEALHALEFLHLTNIKPDDGSLRPLGSLARLKNLEIANFYSTTEFAWLARTLPSTACQWFRPYVEITFRHCAKCGAASMVMLTGRGTKALCVQCDARKLDAHLREWNGDAGAWRIRT